MLIKNGKARGKSAGVAVPGLRLPRMKVPALGLNLHYSDLTGDFPTICSRLMDTSLSSQWKTRKKNPETNESKYKIWILPSFPSRV
jgi:hypothetical protein